MAIALPHLARVIFPQWNAASQSALFHGQTFHLPLGLYQLEWYKNLQKSHQKVGLLRSRCLLDPSLLRLLELAEAWHFLPLLRLRSWTS